MRIGVSLVTELDLFKSESFAGAMAVALKSRVPDLLIVFRSFRVIAARVVLTALAPISLAGGEAYFTYPPDSWQHRRRGHSYRAAFFYLYYLVFR